MQSTSPWMSRDGVHPAARVIHEQRDDEIRSLEPIPLTQGYHDSSPNASLPGTSQPNLTQPSLIGRTGIGASSHWAKDPSYETRRRSFVFLHCFCLYSIHHFEKKITLSQKRDQKIERKKVFQIFIILLIETRPKQFLARFSDCFFENQVSFSSKIYSHK